MDLSVRAARLNITLETRDEDHAKVIINKIKKLGFKVEEKKKTNFLFYSKTFLNLLLDLYLNGSMPDHVSNMKDTL